MFLIRLAVGKFSLMSVLSLDGHCTPVDILKIRVVHSSWSTPSYQYRDTDTHRHTTQSVVGHICFHLNLADLPDVLNPRPGDVKLF